MPKKKAKQQKKHKKLPFFFTFLLIMLIGGGIGGYYVGGYVMKNDKFILKGDKVINLTVGQEYQEEGWEVVAYGKKVDDKKVHYESNFVKDTAGQYYIKYTVDGLRFKGITRYRVIYVVEPEEPAEDVGDEEIENVESAGEENSENQVVQVRASKNDTAQNGDKINLFSIFNSIDLVANKSEVRA